MTACSTCGAPAARAHGLCPACVDAWAVAQRADQGLPDTVTDPAVLARVAAATEPRPDLGVAS